MHTKHNRLMVRGIAGILLFVSFLSLLNVSCKKGDTGPEGPQGPPGVVYSTWAPADANSSKDTTIDGSKIKMARITAPKLADTILTKGTVLVYFTFGSGIFPLPYTSNAGGLVNTMSFIPQLHSIIVTRFTHDNSGSINLSTQLQYRYIIIPGGVNASGRQMGVDYKSMTYEEVCRYLGIPE